MLSDPDPQRTAALAAVLRREQFTAVATRSVATSVCSLGSFAAVASAFWNSGSHGFLVGMFATLAVLHGVAILRGRTWIRSCRSDVSDRQLIARVAITALIATTWCSILLLMPGATADQRQLVIYVFSGLTTSSLLIAPLLPAALAMAGITTAALLLVMPFMHHVITGQHALVAVLFFGMTMAAVRSYNRSFRHHVENEAVMREQKNTIALLLKEFEESSSDLLWETDAGFVLRDPSPRICTILGRTRSQLAALDIRTLLDADPSRHTDDIGRFHDATSRHEPFRDLKVPMVLIGQPLWFCLSGRPVRDADGTFRGYRGVATDVTAAQRSTDRIAFLARYDSLTGLPNRILFHETLEATAGSHEPFALLCLDLDGFKPVNDTYGHGVGDELLVMVAARLRGCVRGGDVVGRLGGDEFAVLLPATDEPAAALLAERLIEAIGRPFAIRDIRVTVTLSVGIVAATAGMAPEQLLQAADIALYESKRRARGTWSLFEQSMADTAQERHLLLADLRDAVAGRELHLAFQPILDTRNHRIACVEALVRWTHPRLGAVGPDRFIPLAEENGLIVPLGAWVLRDACRMAATWPDDVRLAVNLSPLQLRQPDLLAMVDAVLAETRLPPGRLEIEITESVFLEDAATTLACLRGLRERGIRISLDDFGTGYSSLSYLRSFPFDKVKIDRSFVRDLHRGNQSLAIIHAIIGMANSLGINTTGEGVETDQQAAILDAAGCDEVQGFLFGRPCSGTEISRLIDTGPAPSRPFPDPDPELARTPEIASGSF